MSEMSNNKQTESQADTAYIVADRSLFEIDRGILIKLKDTSLRGSVIIPDGVTAIGSGAFRGCGGITSITIPCGVTSIGDCAFYGCDGLINVRIPDSVTSIGKYAFCCCGSLTSIEVSDNVASIGEGAFGGCSRLRRIVFNGTQKQWEKIYPYSRELYGVEVAFSE